MSVAFDFAVALDSAPGEILVKPPNLSNFPQHTDSLPDIISQKCPNHPLQLAQEQRLLLESIVRRQGRELRRLQVVCAQDYLSCASTGARAIGFITR